MPPAPVALYNFVEVCVVLGGKHYSYSTAGENLSNNEEYGC